jgi:L-arabinonolactonase
MGTVNNRRGFASTETSPVAGYDDSTVNSDGFVWNALVYDGKILRYAPTRPWIA